MEENGASAQPVFIGYLIGSKDYENFQRGLNAYGYQSQKLNLRRVFQRIKEDYYNRGYAQNADGTLIPQLPPDDEMPSFRQFEYWHHSKREKDPETSIVNQKSRRRYELAYRPILGDSTQMAFGPGSIYQIDSTVADLYLVSSLNV